MTLFLPQLVFFIARRMRALKSAALMGLVVVALSSCSRAAYVFRPVSPSYLATERPAPSVPAYSEGNSHPDSLTAIVHERSYEPAQGPPKKPRLHATKPSSRLQARAHLWATKIVAKRISKHAIAPNIAPSTAHYEGTAGPSGTLVVSLCLLIAGLVGLIIGATISTNIVGAIFGVFLFILGSAALIAGAILLLIALLARK
jgi:hypothetical protein